MYTIKDIKETIYHELGHIIVYVLANADKQTSLGDLRMILLGRKNAVVPFENLYYYELLKPTDHIFENSKNIKRTLCWIILQFSGCLFESYYEGSVFEDCFSNSRGCSGNRDYDNLFHMRHYSSFEVSDADVTRLKEKFTIFLETENLFEKMKDYMEHFLEVFGSNDNICLAGDDIEILVDEINDRVLSEAVILSFHKMISEELNNFL